MPGELFLKPGLVYSEAGDLFVGLLKLLIDLGALLRNRDSEL